MTARRSCRVPAGRRRTAKDGRRHVALAAVGEHDARARAAGVSGRSGKYGRAGRVDRERCAEARGGGGDLGSGLGERPVGARRERPDRPGRAVVVRRAGDDCPASGHGDGAAEAPGARLVRRHDPRSQWRPGIGRAGVDRDGACGAGRRTARRRPRRRPTRTGQRSRRDGRCRSRRRRSAWCRPASRSSRRRQRSMRRRHRPRQRARRPGRRCRRRTARPGGAEPRRAVGVGRRQRRLRRPRAAGAR